MHSMLFQVLQLGLEGLVLKDLESTYEPGKRHWLKVKKDYLFDGAMADTADLVVLGAWFGRYQFFFYLIYESTAGYKPRHNTCGEAANCDIVG